MRKKRQRRPVLNALVRQWQARLKLQDWEIDSHYAGLSTLTNPADEAKVDWLEENQTAVIFVKKTAEPETIESTMIHELLHIRLDPVIRKDKKAQAHQAIYAIEGAFAEVLALIPPSKRKARR